MNKEVEDMIEVLLASEPGSSAPRKAALKRLGEILEEDYILNLPPQKPILRALETLAQTSGVEPALKNKAQKLIKAYGV